MNIQQLKELAVLVDEVGTLTIEAPKKGDYFYDKYEISSERGVYAECGDENDAKFIIAFTPKVAIELIDALEAAERERDEAIAAHRKHAASLIAGRGLLRERAEAAEAELARRDAAAGEPFAYVDSSHLDEFGWGYVFKQSSPMRAGCKFPVYAAAPPALLPPEMLPENTVEIETLRGVKLSQMQRAIAADAYNQCRADTMALGAQQQKVFEFPEPVKWPEIPFKYFSEEQVFSMLDEAGVKWEVKK